MAMQVETDGFVFDFNNKVQNAFVFDSAMHNGIRNMMKSVDVIAEFPDEYLFIELKNYLPLYGGMEFRCPLCDDKQLIKTKCPLSDDDGKRVKDTVKRIARDLRQKYFDTFLYCYAEDKMNKPVIFICVVEGCDTALVLRLKDIISGLIPKGIPEQTKWVKPILKNVFVVNVSAWNASSKLKCYGNCSLSV